MSLRFLNLLKVANVSEVAKNLLSRNILFSRCLEMDINLAKANLHWDDGHGYNKRRKVSFIREGLWIRHY